MKPPSLNAVIGAVLEPEGFRKAKTGYWLRDVRDFIDCVDIQLGGSFQDFTINLGVIDRINEALVLGRPFHGIADAARSPIRSRLSHMAQDCPQWWPRSDPAVHAEAAEALRTYGLPFLERMHDLEAVLAHLEARGSIKWRDPTARMHVAALLSRLGRAEEACAALADPPKRLADGDWLDRVEALRRRVCPPDGLRPIEAANPERGGRRGP